jgi:hypothetical protein
MSDGRCVDRGATGRGFAAAKPAVPVVQHRHEPRLRHKRDQLAHDLAVAAVSDHDYPPHARLTPQFLFR